MGSPFTHQQSSRPRCLDPPVSNQYMIRCRQPHCSRTRSLLRSESVAPSPESVNGCDPARRPHRAPRSQPWSHPQSSHIPGALPRCTRPWSASRSCRSHRSTSLWRPVPPLGDALQPCRSSRESVRRVFQRQRCVELACLETGIGRRKAPRVPENAAASRAPRRSRSFGALPSDTCSVDCAPSSRKTRQRRLSCAAVGAGLVRAAPRDHLEMKREV
mmetsp:Transcript_41309/g.104145  ORF Transcript_41309/g.104145 Transcript_41309/m.104145 type:complete len:216 (+) Transcript_41309:2959-3606(+)